MTLLCLFEDAGWSNLRPFTQLRPACMLRVGRTTILEAWQQLIPHTTLCLQYRAHLRPVVREQLAALKSEPWEKESDILLVNDRCLPTLAACEQALALKPNSAVTHHGTMVMAKLDAPTRAQLDLAPETPLDTDRVLSLIGPDRCLASALPLLNDPWDLVRYNPVMFRDQSVQYAGMLGRIAGHCNTKAVLINEGHITVGEHSVVHPLTVLDASAGPIWIGKNCVIEPFAYLQGPVAIDDHCTVKSHTQCRSGTSLGPYTKVGGELSNAIFLGYSNKGHEGFVGDSYIGSWVNLGAGTTTSNLKNNYSTIRMVQNHDIKETGLQFLGSLIGDFSKTGIGTLLGTGTHLSIFSNVFGGGLAPKYTAEFSWGQHGVRYRIDQAIESALRMTQRRNLTLSPAYQTLIKALYQQLA